MKKIIPKNSSLIPDKANCVFQGKIFDVYHWDQELYDGTSETFEALKRPDTVSVFAVVDGKIIVLEDEQPHRTMVIALPGGRVDAEDSSTLEAAKRETAEETGYSFEKWKLIEVIKPQEKLEWFLYSYIACGKYTKGEARVDGGERVKVDLRTFDEVKALGKAGEQRFKEQTKLAKAENLEDFINTSEFEGQEVDR